MGEIISMSDHCADIQKRSPWMTYLLSWPSANPMFERILMKDIKADFGNAIITGVYAAAYCLIST